MAKKETPVAKKTQPLKIFIQEGEDESEAMERNLLRPNLNALSTITQFRSDPVENPTAMLNELDKQATSAQAGDLARPEEMLSAQAHTLDVLFNRLAQRAKKNMDAGYTAAGETYLRMALKAQSQCRTTVEALAEIKYPKSATFIRQANIANQQQVNNGTQSGTQKNGHFRAHEKDITPANEQLTEAKHAALDCRGSGAAIGGNSTLEAVGAVNRTED